MKKCLYHFRIPSFNRDSELKLRRSEFNREILLDVNPFTSEQIPKLFYYRDDQHYKDWVNNLGSLDSWFKFLKSLRYHCKIEDVLITDKFPIEELFPDAL